MPLLKSMCIDVHVDVHVESDLLINHACLDTSFHCVMINSFNLAFKNKISEHKHVKINHNSVATQGSSKHKQSHRTHHLALHLPLPLTATHTQRDCGCSFSFCWVVHTPTPTQSLVDSFGVVSPIPCCTRPWWLGCFPLVSSFKHLWRCGSIVGHPPLAFAPTTTTNHAGHFLRYPSSTNISSHAQLNDAPFLLRVVCKEKKPAFQDTASLCPSHGSSIEPPRLSFAFGLRPVSGKVIYPLDTYTHHSARHPVSHHSVTAPTPHPQGVCPHSHTRTRTTTSGRLHKAGHSTCRHGAVPHSGHFLRVAALRLCPHSHRLCSGKFGV